MFNFVMGIVMAGAGVVCLIKGCVGRLSPALIFFGCCMIVFGIVEIIRSKNIRKKEQQRKEHEMDAYLRMAAEMGVVVNPITKEIVKKKPEGEAQAEQPEEFVEETQETEQPEETVEELQVEQDAPVEETQTE